MANTKVTGDLIASGTITAANLVSGTLDALLNSYLTTNTYATQGYVTTAVNNLIAAAPASLDTLNELAAALNDDANFATTVTNSLATKLNLSGGTLTGDLGIGISPSSKLHLYTSADSDTAIRIQNSPSVLYVGVDNTTGSRFIGSSGSTAYIGTTTSSPIQFATANTVRATIDSSGNVGIAESDPSGYWGQAHNLVLTDSNTGLTIKSSTAGNGRIVFIDTKGTTAGLSDGGMIHYSHTSDSMQLHANGSERIRITSGGNVGIGTTSPTGTYGKLTVNGSISLLDDQNTKLEIGRYSNAAPNAYIKLGANANSLRVTNNIDSVDIFNITNSGDVSIGTTSPLLTNPGRGNLTINGSADAILTLGIGGTHKAWFYHTASANTAYLSTIDSLAFESGSAVRMYLASGGNVGINTTSPAQQLHVNGVTLSQGLYIPGLTTLPNTQGAIQADVPSTSYNAFRLRDTATGSSHTIHGFASNWSGGVSPGHLNLEGITAVSFGTWVGPNMIIHHATGNVGIGIGDSTPDGRLTISAGAENQTAPVNAIRIKGPNVPSGANSSQNISWDFSYAGSAKIRAHRGASWGTQIDFLTNTSSQGSDNPGVKLSILDNGGITFNGDTSQANALDDYEEGAFTPTVPGATAYAAQLGKYTKIGNVVYFHLYVQPSAGTYTSSFILIDGLPFTSVNNAILYPKLSTSWSGFGFSGTVLVAQVQPNATTIGAVGCTNNGTFTDVNRTGWSNNDWLTITGFYYTS